MQARAGNAGVWARAGTCRQYKGTCGQRGPKQ